MFEPSGAHRRRPLGILLAVILALAMLGLPVRTLADEGNTPDDPDITWIEGDEEIASARDEAAERLGDTLQTSGSSNVTRLLELMRIGVDHHQTSVDVSSANVTKDEVEWALPFVYYDRSIYILRSGYGYSGPDNHVTRVYFKYPVDVSSLPSWEAEAEKKIAEALSWIDSSMSTAQKAQALHDYLVRNCQYDYDAAYGRTSSKLSFTGLGALVNGKAVCQGYCDAYDVLLERAGIPSEFIVSATMGHSWNAVLVNGRWYNVDVTWDDPTVNGSDQGFGASVSHRYFLKSDSTFQRLSHKDWFKACQAETTPTCPSDYKMSYGTYKKARRSISCMYRLYNPWSGEHLFTANVDEFVRLPQLGWRREGLGWIAPKSGTAVYRLYNPYSGDHFYTASESEYDHLGSIGWRKEGVGFHSATSGNRVPIYRLYNRWLTAGTHLFTTDHDEYYELVRAGWRGEGVAFYGV